MFLLALEGFTISLIGISRWDYFPLYYSYTLHITKLTRTTFQRLQVEHVKKKKKNEASWVKKQINHTSYQKQTLNFMGPDCQLAYTFNPVSFTVKESGNTNVHLLSFTQSVQHNWFRKDQQLPHL